MPHLKVKCAISMELLESFIGYCAPVSRMLGAGSGAIPRAVNIIVFDDNPPRGRCR